MKKKLLLIFLSVGIAVISLRYSYAQEEMPEKAKKLFLKAEKYYHHFAYYKAIEQYKHFLLLQKNNHEAMLKIASSYFHMKEYDQTLSWYDSALTNGDIPSEHEVQYAEVLMNHGQHEKAKYWFKKYLENQPNDKRAQEKLQGLENIDKFYSDSSLYKLTNLPINSAFADFSPTYYRDGFIFVSAREEAKREKDLDHRSNGSYLDLYYCVMNDSAVGSPESLGNVINSSFHEGPIALYDSGRKMIFTRNDFIKKKNENGTNTVHFQLFHTEKNREGEWSKPKLLNLHDKHYSIGHPTISTDEKTLYFASNMPGGYGGSDLYKSTWENDKWGHPVNLGPLVNTEGNEMFPYLLNDTILYFSSDGFGGLGGLDIFKTSLKTTGQVYNLGYPINSTKDDFGIILDQNATQGYFSSNREGGVGADDIYKFTMGNEEVEPMPEPQPIPVVQAQPTPEPPVEVYYTIQILALRNPKVVHRSFLKKLKGVLRHTGKDGLHRYTYGEYKGPEDAFDMLKTIHDMGYLDAFIRRVERYAELSKAPGEDVERLYQKMGRVD